MKKIIFIDDGIEFDSLTRLDQPTGGAENAFISLVESLARKGFNISEGCKEYPNNLTHLEAPLFT